MGFLNCYWHYVVIRLRNGEDVKKKTVIHISPLIYWCVLLRIAFMSVTYYSSPVFIFSVFLHCFELSRIMVSKGMFSKSKYWISEKIRVCQCLFSCIFKSIFQSQNHNFQIMYCKSMVSKNKYWISENNNSLATLAEILNKGRRGSWLVG